MMQRSKEFQEGYEAGDIYATSASNPYPGGTREWSEWEAGFQKRDLELEPSSFSTYNRILPAWPDANVNLDR